MGFNEMFAGVVAACSVFLFLFTGDSFLRLLPFAVGAGVAAMWLVHTLKKEIRDRFDLFVASFVLVYSLLMAGRIWRFFG